ncbi:glycoside hydrolase family 3 protein [Desulfoplanes formicivorans]|uniref:Glycoside hydrolase family 3 n=1 Tax=Desulfoplanes formicivorans TaxID=1592317 RepID=A0A194AKI4_9BACT|nr:glycoside hydrolase family 3 protein [Desulfoplanes formicivorans]GAU09566.1 glycoside hydrolase family 3 [Desulfoplanes formicivorans]
MQNHLFPIMLALVLSLCPACSRQATATGTRTPDLDTMMGQMLMVGFRDQNVDENSPIVRDIKDRHLGSVILFDYDVNLHQSGRNIASFQQVQKLVSTLKHHASIPLLVAVDQEGGRVARLKPAYGFPALPSAQDLGRDHDPERTRKAGELTGKTLKDVGINWDLAPVVDVNVNPCSPAIGNLGRSFSSDPHQVVAHAEAFITGLHEYGVLSCLKHFPGHGSARSDSHQGFTDVSSTWSPQELIPYRQLVSKGTCDAIMTAHIFNRQLDARFPATLSRATITDLLRRDMGFDGVILTDDMQMGAIANEYGLKQAIYHALKAGADILVFGNNLEYDPDITAKAIQVMNNLVTSGQISRDRIARSFARIMELKKKLQVLQKTI